MNPDFIKYSFPVRWQALGRLTCFPTNFIVLFRSFKRRILNMPSFFCYFLPIFLVNHSLITFLISVCEELVFFFFASCFVTRFTWFCLSWVVSPIWAVVILKVGNFLSIFFRLARSILGSQSSWAVAIRRQNFSLFFHLVLSLLGSQSYLGCCYLKAEP